MSRVPVYLTLLPVWVSHGSTIARKAFCSSPPQVPITVTDLPPLDHEPPQAATTNAATPRIAATRRQLDFRCSIRDSFHGPPPIWRWPISSITPCVGDVLCPGQGPGPLTSNAWLVDDLTISSVGSSVRFGTWRPATRSSNAVPAARPRS